MSKPTLSQVVELNKMRDDFLYVWKDGKCYCIENDYVVKNPGIKVDHQVCLKASKLNIPVINELEVAYHYLPKNTKIIAITSITFTFFFSFITYSLSIFLLKLILHY